MWIAPASPVSPRIDTTCTSANVIVSKANLSSAAVPVGYVQSGGILTVHVLNGFFHLEEPVDHNNRQDSNHKKFRRWTQRWCATLRAVQRLLFEIYKTLGPAVKVIVYFKLVLAALPL